MPTEEVLRFKADTSKAEKDIEKLQGAIDDTTKSTEETNKAMEEVGGQVDTITGGAVSKFKKLKTSVGTVTKGFNAMKLAIAATGLGALLIVITSIVQSFKRSEEGQNKFNKIMGIISATTGVFLDRLADLGTGIISVFTDPVQAVKDLYNTIQSFIVKQVQTVTEGFGLLGKAIMKTFEGDFKGAVADAGQGLKKLLVDTNPVVIATKALASATAELTKEIVEEGKAAAKIADQRAKADKIDRDLLVERAEANREFERLKGQAIDKENLSLAERQQALKDALALDEEITNKEIEAARLRLEAKQAENALGLSTKEDLEEEANLKANLINLETTRLSKAKELQAQVIALGEEQRREDEAKRLEDEAKKLEHEQTLADIQNQIREATALSQAELDQLEIEKAQEKYDLLIEQAKQFGLDTTELEASKLEAVAQLKDKFAKREDDANQQNSDNAIQWEEMTQQQKTAIVSQGFQNMASILGEETAAGKAAAIAAATISTYQMATDSYKSLSGIPIIGPVLGAAAAGAAIVAGIANVKKITATKTPQLGGKGGGAGAGAGTPSISTPPPPPSFNAVGESGSSQLADVIAGSEQKPVKAFVVSNDVTTAQSLDRNIVNEASI